MIGFRLVDVGNLIQNGAQTAIAIVRQVHPIAVVFALPEAELPQVKQALKVGTLPVRAVASSGAVLDAGLLVTPDNAIDPTTGMIALKAVFVNAHDQLWPGQHVDAQLQLGVRRGALVVPSSAVQHGPDGLFVYLAGPDRTVTVRPVEVGLEAAGQAVVTSGLQDGDDVVVDGQSRLQDGSRIASAAEPAR